MKADLLVFLVGVLHVLQINGQKTKSEQILEAKIRRLEKTDLEAKVHLLPDNNGGMTSKPERAVMEQRIQSLESEVLDWKKQVNLLQITVNKLVQQSNATEDKVVALDANNHAKTVWNNTLQEVGNVPITVGQLASGHEDIKKGGNDTFEATDGLQTTASNATRQEVPVGRCNALFPNEPNRFPEVHKKDGDGWTPLHPAAQSSTFDKVCQLLKKGADPNAKDKDGRTPLLFAAAVNSNVDVTRVLLEKGADPNAKDKDGWTPLHWAARVNKNVDVTRVLLENGADPNARDDDGRTSLSDTYSDAIKSILIKHGARF